MFSMWAHALWARVCAVALATPLLFAGVAPVWAGHPMTPAFDSESQVEFIGDFQPDAPPPVACLTSIPIGCFGPDTIRPAYGIPDLKDPNVNGAGRTIVIIDAFASPNIGKDLAMFDGFWGMTPPSLRVIPPASGFATANAGTLMGWSQETSLDVEWANAIAPKANLVLVQARSGNDIDLVAALKYAVDNNLGDVITQSFGEAEACADPGLLAEQHATFEAASRLGITVFASSGDQGPARPTCDGKPNSYMFAASTPASDPEVTAVGGTHLVANKNGATTPETVWNTTRGAGGGGFSSLYRRPGYQAPFQKNNKARGLPDVAYDADRNSGFLVVWNGHGLLAFGTSAGAPQWAGIAALAAQVAGHRLGPINKTLYHLAKSDAYSGAFHDVTIGDNSWGGFTGFSAGPGWDPATGLGTPNVSNLIPLLAAGDD